MLLCDQVIAMKQRINYSIVSDPKNGSSSIRRVVATADKLAGAPRFILANDVTEALIESSIAYPEALAGCIDAIRIPWRIAWFEWDDEFARSVWRRSHAKKPGSERSFLPKRGGFLVEADESGRSGEISVCWPIPEPDGKGGLTENYDRGLLMSNFQAIRFDLDLQDMDIRRIVGAESFERETGIPIGDINFTNDVEPARSRYIDRIKATMMMDWSKTEVAALLSGQLHHHGTIRFISNAVSDIWSEYCMLVPAAAMMNARNAVRIAQADRTRINKSRAKAGRLPLLDHQVVSMNISPEEKAERRQAAACRRSGPRATHWVRGHLVHRSGAIFWRRPHIRMGIGDRPAGKTVKVHGQPDVRASLEDTPSA